MSLDIQIVGLLISLMYGIAYSAFIGFNYKMLFNTKLYIKIISSLIVVLLGILIYFLILKNVISGEFHIYFLFMILFGCLIENLFVNRLANLRKK